MRSPQALSKLRLFPRYSFLGVAGLLAVTVGAAWWAQLWLSISASDGIAIHLVIDNRTAQEIGPFVVADESSGTALPIGLVPPNTAASLDFVTPHISGENFITMSDCEGTRYVVIGYFEHSIRGRVDIIVNCAGPLELSGQRREITSYFLSFGWRRWGVLDCVKVLD
jgi:hypothetical protein